MKKLLASWVFFMLILSVVSAIPDYLQRSDDLSFADRHMESFNLLIEMLPTATTDQQRAEIYWRLSRDTLLDTDNRRSEALSTELLISLYKKGEAYADQAIALDPDNAKGYFLKACNIGRWGQAPGAHITLSQVDLMRKLLVKAAWADPYAGDPWFVLGQLYEQVPGWPFSFGSAEWAVSLGRKALDARKLEVFVGAARDVPFDYSVQLARHLSKRNWSSAKRAHEQPNEARKFFSTTDPIEKNFYYEGIVHIPPISDRAEARLLCMYVISELQGVSERTQNENTDFKNAQSTLAGLGKE
jgi:hypothetical protein